MHMPTAETPSPSPTPAHGWTPERRALFLEALSHHGNARAACRRAGMSAESAYKLRRREPLFARGWAAALVLGRDASISALGERAVEGIEEPIYYRGELIGTRRRYDSRLLLAHLARLDQLAEEDEAGEDAGRFDELVACIAEGSDEPLAPRSDHITQAGLAAGSRLRDHQTNEHPALFGERGARVTHSQARRLGELDDACIRVAMRAADEAGEEWDRRLRDAAATVDALCHAGPNTRAERLHPALAALVVTRPDKQAERDANAGRVSFPCTLSTASTVALARGLAGPVPFHPPTPRSPFRRR